MRICVYGAASPTIDKKYIELVEKMGQEISSLNGAAYDLIQSLICSFGSGSADNSIRFQYS